MVKIYSLRPLLFPDGYPDNALQETTWVIADLLHEALETARRQAERIRRLNN